MHKTIQIGEDGESIGVDGVAAGWAISCMGVREAEIKAVIDRVLDQEIQRAPLPPGVLGSVHVRHINEWGVNGTGQTMDGAPRRIDVTFGKTATGVVFSVEIE